MSIVEGGREVWSLLPGGGLPPLLSRKGITGGPRLRVWTPSHTSLGVGEEDGGCGTHLAQKRCPPFSIRC